MKQILMLILFMSINHSLLTAQKPVVTVLGTYHFANPGLDAANIQSDDVKTEKRQAELQALADSLAQFQPTKIVVEAPYGNESILARYNAFMEHKIMDSLPDNEIYQIGFRLAAKLNHPTVYPIDHKMSIDPASMSTLLEENPECMNIINDRISEIQDSLNYWTEKILERGTITDFLRFLNQDKQIEKNYNIYLDFTKDIYSRNSYAGAEMLSNWHERNIMIFQNLTRITDFTDSNERILVIFGQGHSKILKDLINDSNYYQLTNILNYLN